MPSPPFHRSSEHPWLLCDDTAHVEPLAILSASQDEGRAAWILRDDLLHPWANGNKLRKFDGYLPALRARGVTDLLTCGGVQSAHCAALSCLASERGMRAHVLLRGEAPAVPTGNLAITLMYATSVTHVTRDEYARRAEMLEVASETRRRRLAEDAVLEVIPEGGMSGLALLGFERLIAQLMTRLQAPDEPWELVIDAGTGMSTAGLVSGIMRHKLPWRVRSVMLMPRARETYARDVEALLASCRPDLYEGGELPLTWEARQPERRFGAFKAAELVRCQQLARSTGVLFDPIYTLASYESVCAEPASRDARTLLLHTGGGLNVFGALARYPRALS